MVVLEEGMTRLEGVKASRLVEVKGSRIHGYGLFAKKPIAEGTCIIEYLGERITNREADRRESEKGSSVAAGHTFMFQVSSRHTIDGGKNGNAARFLNHSCDGNCYAEVSKGRVFIIATKAIRAGEELTFDYALHISGERASKETIRRRYRCFCGSIKCRKTMVATIDPPCAPKISANIPMKKSKR